MKSLLSHHVAFDVLPDGVAIFDRETGALLDANDQMCRIHGYSREELLALKAEDLYAEPALDRSAPPQRVIQKTAADRPQRVRWLGQRKDGECFGADVHLRRATLEDTAYTVATIREVTPPRTRIETAEAEACSDGRKSFTRAPTHLQPVTLELPVYVFRQDRGLRYTWVSSTASGLDATDFLGHSDAELLPEEEAALIQPVKLRVLETGKAACIEMEGTLGGRNRFFETHLVPERDATGTITGLLGAAVDVTDQRNARFAEFERERRYRELFETTKEGIVILAPDRTITDVNPAATEILGYSKDEFLAMNWDTLLAGTRRRARLQEMLRKNGAIHNVELSLRRKDGAKITCMVSAVVQHDADGQPHAYFASFCDVTERRRQETQFRLLVQEVKEYAIFMLDVNGHVTTWNEGATAIKGYAKDEILGKHFSTFYTAEDARAGVPANGLKTAKQTGQWKAEGWRLRKDGSRFWAHVTITALHGEDGALCGFAKITHDMTAWRHREQKLRRSEARYRRLFEESQEGIVITTPAGKIVDANAAARRLMGYNRADMRTMKARDLYVNPEMRTVITQILAEKGVLRDFEVQIRRKDGGVITCRLSATALRGSDGAIAVYQTLLRDVTDEKRALQALRDSEERFRVFAEKALIGIGLLQENADGEIVYRYANPALARLSGYTSEEIIDRSPEKLFHPGDWPHIRESLRKRLNGVVREAHYETRLHTKTGETRVVEVMGSRFTYQDKPTIIGTVQDITERHRLEKELLWIQEKERRRIGRALHDGVASELTGAGTLVSVVANRAKQGMPIAPEDVDQIGKLIRTSTREIRRLARGLSPAELDAGLIPALKGLAHRTSAQNDLICSFEALGTVPRLPKETAVHLYRIAQEAIQNAVKHAAARRIRIRYGLETDGLLMLEIHDDGRGGAKQSLLEGTPGLGLPTMRYRANLIGATLNVEDVAGDGTTVRCRIRTPRFQSGPST